MPAGTEATEAESGNGRVVAGRRRMGAERLFIAALLLAALAIYLAAGERLGRSDAFWSPDMGARWAMIRSWRHGDSLVYIPYANADVDPSGQFHPLGLLTPQHLIDGHALRLRRRFCTQFPPLFPLLCAWASRLPAGRCLTLVPCVTGVLAVWAVYLLAWRLRLRSRLLVATALAFATPVLIYAGLFWDLNVQILICAVSSLLLLGALQTGRFRLAAASGACLGFGIFFHELFGLMFAALLAGSIVVLKSAAGRRAVAGLAAGFLPMLAVWILTNCLIYGLPLGPHLAVASNIRHSAVYAAQMSPANMGARALSQLFGLQPGQQGNLFPVLLLAVGWAICSAIGRKAAPGAPLFLALIAPIALAWLMRADLAFGLFQATPLLWAALAWPGRERLDEGCPDADPAPDAATLFRRWILAAWLLFLAVVAVNPQDPGLNWGSRYMLTTLPWGAVLAACALESAFSNTRGFLRAGAPAAAAALIAVGVLANVRGMREIESETAGFANLALEYNTPAQAVVFGSWDWAGHPKADPPPHLFLVRDPATEGESFLSILDRLSISEFTFDGTPETFTQMRIAGLRHYPQFVIAGRESELTNAVRFRRLPPGQFVPIPDR